MNLLSQNFFPIIIFFSNFQYTVFIFFHNFAPTKWLFYGLEGQILMDSCGKAHSAPSLMGGLGWVFQREKGRLRTLSSTVKPGKFEVREGIAIEASAWVIYIPHFCVEYICHDVGQLVAYPLTGQFPGPDGGISEYKLPTSFCIHHI